MGARAGEIGPPARVIYQRAHDRGQAVMLAVMQMIGLGCGKQDLVDPLLAHHPRQKARPPGPKGCQDRGHGLAEIGHGFRSAMDRLQDIDQHHLAIDPGKMSAEKRFDHLRLIGLEAAFAFARQRSAWCRSGRQGRKGQRRAALQVAGQQEAARCAIGKARLLRGAQIGGPSLCKGGKLRLILRRIGAGLGHKLHIACRLGPRGGTRQGRARPCLIVLRKQAQIEQPFAGVIHDIEMHDAWPGQPRQKPPRPDPERDPQFRHGAGAFGPMGCCPRQSRQMVFKIETRHGIVGLRLQIGRFDPAHARGLQPRHPPAFQKIGHQRGDEHGLACPAQTGDAQPDHRGREEPCHTMRHIRDLVAKRLRNRLDDQLGHPFAVFLRE